ncbi:dicarboxylate/amino acid:cation symporter [Propionimicrobium sp. PCR01-08-3]|uniref:dicarboxylate/amino acid:cation symporter n=1 Tax=Propionimicrobium sp. PCR01-08-3 TaxID=3052086 RepID=UPI00255C3550|nr:dicarboxylate/amino acid:cation symporter [Propionimicrobium sp. PCR01-08-3]WIY83689.1 dicarboxylate/amino acid:cation symporter [Propionimicrobium sp. PCR01-08-3]
MSVDTDQPTKHKIKAPSFGVQVIIGLVIGILLGAFARSAELDWLTEVLTQVGSIFVQLLRVVVVPLVFLALVVSISQLRKVTNAAKLAAQTLEWFAITAFIAVVIGIGIGLLTNPGQGTGIDISQAEASSTQGGWLDFLKSIVPANFLGMSVSSTAEVADAEVAVTSSVSFNVLQIVVLGIAVGGAALAAGTKAEPFLRFSESALEIFQKLVWWIIRLAPIGSAALIGKAVASYGWDLVRPLAVFTVDVYVGCALVMFAVYPAILKLNGLSVKRFFAGAWESITLAFVSRSSVGTLPVTQRNMTENLGVPKEYAAFAAPLGATTKMDGCAAIYPALAAITVAQMFGINLSITDYLLIVFVAVVGSAATAGLTGAVVMLTLTLSTLGLPLEGVGLLLAIDPILDMMRTATNVAGQSLVTVVVSKRNAILNRDRYDGPNPSTESDAEARPAREPATV